MRDVVRAAFHDFSAPLEGREVPFMYLDSADPVGFVTIATGCLIDPVSMAVGLPFQRPDGGLATRAEIVACWSLVKGRQDLRKHGGMVYGGLAGNTLRLDAGGTRNLVDKRLTWFDAELSKVFPDYEDWPACAQLFALSWGWAVGAHAKYPKMIERLNMRNFAGAAEECTINPQRGTILTRNARNRILLRNADRIQAYHLDPDLLNWDAIIGVQDADTQPDISLPSSIPPPLVNTDMLPTYNEGGPLVLHESTASQPTRAPEAGDYLSPDEPDDV